MSEFSYGSDSQALAVYAVALPAFLGLHPGLAVLDPQTAFSYEQASWEHCYEVVNAESFIAPALWRALPEVNSTPLLLEPAAASGISPDLIAPAVEQRESLQGAGYFGPNAFTEAYPGMSLVQVSRVAFSPDEQRALVYVWRTCGELCGDGAVYALVRDGATWTITFRSGLGAS